MCEYLRGGAGEGPSGTAGRPSSLPAAADSSLSVVGSLYIVIGLTRRAVILGLRWSADWPIRRFVVAVIAAVIAASLATPWASQGQFRGW
jgi:hypothetical protein